MDISYSIIQSSLWQRFKENWYPSTCMHVSFHVSMCRIPEHRAPYKSLFLGWGSAIFLILILTPWVRFVKRLAIYPYFVIHLHLNSIAWKHPLSSTRSRSSCWYLNLMLADTYKGITIHLLLALGVKIYPRNFTLDLIETDVIEPFKTGTTDCPNTMVRN